MLGPSSSRPRVALGTVVASLYGTSAYLMPRLPLWQRTVLAFISPAPETKCPLSIGSSKRLYRIYIHWIYRVLGVSSVAYSSSRQVILSEGPSRWLGFAGLQRNPNGI